MLLELVFRRIACLLHIAITWSKSSYELVRIGFRSRSNNWKGRISIGTELKTKYPRG